MSQNLSNEDYEKLKAFVAAYMEHYAEGPVPREIHPLTVLVNLEKVSIARARKGLLLAVQDLVESTSEWAPGKVAEADRRFVLLGSFSLSDLRRRYSRRYIQVMQRGSIRSAIEYCMLKSMVDGSSIEPGASESETILEMLAEYERRSTQ